MIDRIDREQYVLDELLPEALEEIEGVIGHRIPTPLREVLSKVGWLQNVFRGNWPQSCDEFIRMQELAPDGYTAFIDDGASNYYVMSEEGHLRFWDHEADVAHDTDEDFQSFMDGLIRAPEPSEDLAWHVQMAFNANGSDDVIELLAEHLGLTPVGAWAQKDTSSAGVTTHVLPVVVDGIDAQVSRQSYAEWDDDIFYLNRVIPIDRINAYRNIFQKLEEAECVQFKLVNYGILPADLEEDT